MAKDEEIESLTERSALRENILIAKETQLVRLTRLEQQIQENRNAHNRCLALPPIAPRPPCLPVEAARWSLHFERGSLPPFGIFEAVSCPTICGIPQERGE